MVKIVGSVVSDTDVQF